MALSDFNIKVTIGAETSQFENSVKRVQTQTAKLSSGFSNLTQSLKKTFIKGGVVMTGIHLATKALKGMYDTVKKGIKLNEEAKQKQNLLAQTLKVTGAEAWTTVEALNEMANSLQEVTNYSGEEITDMQTLLLGFKNVTGDNFKEAQNAILDMATVMKMDLTSATQTVAKALDDPIKGLGSLQRQGFAFSETQKKMLEDMVAVGDIAKAQKIILDELNTTYGGAAKAGAKPLTQLRNNWNDLLKEMGRNIALDIDIKPATEKINKLVKTWKAALDEMADLKEKSDKLIEAQEAVQKGTATDEQSLIVKQREIELIQQQIDLYQEMYDNAESFEDKQYALNHLKSLGLEIGQLKSQAKVLQSNIDKRKEEAKIAEEKRKTLQDEEDKLTALNNLIDRYNKEIEAQKKQWDLTEEVTGEAIEKTDKLKFYEELLVKAMTEANGEIKQGNDFYDKQMQIILNLKKEIQSMQSGEEKKTGNDWEQKLREQMIARLEADKEEKLAEVENTKYANIQKERLTVEYNEQIKGLKLEALSFEEQEALESVKDLENAEEEKNRIRKYYENERLNLIISYAKENKKAGEYSAKSFADGFKSVTKRLTPIMKEIGKVLSSIGNIAKSMFQGGVSIFSKLFNIDINTVLDAILKIEDKVLSFFVETLPKLPQFVASVMQSISVLLESVLQVVTPEKVSEILINIMNTIIEYGPTIIGAISDILGNMIDGMIEAMPQILDALNVIVEKLAEELPTLIQKLIDFFIAILQEPDKIAKFVVTLIKGFVEIFNVLLRNIGPLLEALLPAIGTMIIEIIKAIPDILLSMAEALGEALKGIGKFIVNMLIDILNLMFDGISKAWTWIPGTEGIPHIPKLATGTDNAQRGLALVGEAGPELVRFNGGEQVLNNRNTQKALAGMGGNTNEFNVNFYNTKDTTAYAMMSQLRQYNRTLAINGVI